MAELGAWVPASCCQMPRNRREPKPQAQRASQVHVVNLDSPEGQVCSGNLPVTSACFLDAQSHELDDQSALGQSDGRHGDAVKVSMLQLDAVCLGCATDLMWLKFLSVYPQDE